MLRDLMAYPKIFFRYLDPSMWFSNRINWIISEVQGKNFFLIISLASDKVLARLGSWIGTCSFFFIHIHFMTMCFQLNNRWWYVHSRKTWSSNCGARCSLKPIFLSPYLVSLLPIKVAKHGTLKFWTWWRMITMIIGPFIVLHTLIL